MKKFELKASLKLPKLTTKADSKTQKKKAGSALSQGVLKSSTEIESTLPSRLNESMSEVIWGPFNPKYPYLSRGGNPRTSGMRSLIDTGELKDSLKIKTSFLKGKTVIGISYSAPYAALTHYGGAIQPYGNKNAATVLLPPRPWISKVIGTSENKGSYDMHSVLERNILAAWQS